MVESRNEAKRQIRGRGVKLRGEVQEADRVVEPNELPTLLSLGKKKIRLIRP
jgi:hypothetical protein